MRPNSKFVDHLWARDNAPDSSWVDVPSMHLEIRGASLKKKGKEGRSDDYNKDIQNMSSNRYEFFNLSKLVYSVSEAAEVLSVSRQTVYNWIKEGRLVPIYPTSKAQISAEALIRFVQFEQARADESAQSKIWMSR
jgi:excisionase family DNA binding protein